MKKANIDWAMAQRDIDAGKTFSEIANNLGISLSPLERGSKNGLITAKKITKRKTLEQFISEATERHGGKYIYCNAVYTGAKSLITIICQEHGEFRQRADMHLTGRGCKLCADERRRHGIADFIQKANETHGDGCYLYDKVKYAHSFTPIEIVCRRHGTFSQTPHSHLAGKGCPRCVGRNKNTEDFIDASMKTHGSKYRYERTEFVNTYVKVCIICQRHGPFLQLPNNHIHGQGCPTCSRNVSKPETEFLDMIGVPANNRNVFIKTKNGLRYNVDGIFL